MRRNKSVIVGCSILVFIIVGILIYLNKDKRSMESEKKFEIDPVFTLMIVDSNAYQAHKQRLLNVEMGGSSHEVAIKQMTDELLNALTEGISKKTQDQYFTLKKIADLYDYKYDFVGMQDRRKEQLVRLLTEIKKGKKIQRSEENYVLDLSFFLNCVVTLNDSWYEQLGLPLSKRFINSQKSHNSLLRQLHDFEEIEELLEPITVNQERASGISFLKDFAADEFFGGINPNPWFDSDNPINVELNNILLMQKMISENPSYKLAVFYSPI